MSTQELLEVAYKGVVTRKASKEMTRKTQMGTSIYVLHQVQILEGPFKDKTITGERVILNSNNDTKEKFEEGEEVLVYCRRMPRLDDPTKNKWFFTLGEYAETTSDEELDELFETAEVVS